MRSNSKANTESGILLSVPFRYCLTSSQMFLGNTAGTREIPSFLISLQPAPELKAPHKFYQADTALKTGVAPGAETHNLTLKQQAREGCSFSGAPVLPTVCSPSTQKLLGQHLYGPKIKCTKKKAY